MQRIRVWTSSRGKGEAMHLRAARDEVLGQLARPGCMFCREEIETLRRDFFWYLHELYFEPQSIQRMQRSHGFCRRHTKFLLQLGPPSTIGRIYNWMLPPLVAALRAGESGMAEAKSLAPLTPTQRCDGCEGEDRAARSKLHQLQLALRDPEVRAALTGATVLCLAHFGAIAPALSWDELRPVSEAVAGELLPGHSRTEPSWLEVAHGRDRDASVRRRSGPPRADVEAAPASGEEGCSDASWSPSLHALHELIQTASCPVCHLRRQALVHYFDWLSKEAGGPQGDWTNAIWLCRTHAWDFAAGWGELAAHRIATAAGAYWREQLAALSSKLARPPSRNPLARLREVPPQVRGDDDSSHWWQLIRRPAVWSAARASLRSPARQLDELREVVLRGRQCPACQTQQTIAARSVELLLTGLGDPATARLYERSPGICLRDVVLATRLHPDSPERRQLLRVARVRLEVLQWELEEMQRKEAWNVRYEPGAGEASAWRRAVTQVSGSCLDDPLLVGS